MLFQIKILEKQTKKKKEVRAAGTTNVFLKKLHS